MKVENRAYASPIYTLFVSQGSRAQCFNERPGPHSNGLKPSARAFKLPYMEPNSNRPTPARHRLLQVAAGACELGIRDEKPLYNRVAVLTVMRYVLCRDAPCPIHHHPKPAGPV